MSIVAYVGLPGAGKTITAVQAVILPALRSGRHVVTNVAMHWDAVAALGLPGTLDELPLDAIIGDSGRIFEFVKKGTVLVLDEVWKLWPNGVKANNVAAEFKSLLTEHRHMVDDLGNGVQIVLVTQDLASIGAFARQLVEITYRITKLGHVGLPSKFRTDVYKGCVTGQSPPERAKLNTFVSGYEKQVFKLYRSHTQSDKPGGGSNEASLDRRFVIWNSPVLKYGAPLVVLVLAYTGWALWSWYSERTAPAAAAPSVARSGPPPAVAMKPAIAKPSEPAKPEYRVVGWASGSATATVAIKAGEVIVYVPTSSCWQPGDALMHCSFAGWEVTELGPVRPIGAASELSAAR